MTASLAAHRPPICLAASCARCSSHWCTCGEIATSPAAEPPGANRRNVAEGPRNRRQKSRCSEGNKVLSKNLNKSACDDEIAVVVVVVVVLF